MALPSAGFLTPSSFPLPIIVNQLVVLPDVKQKFLLHLLDMVLITTLLNLLSHLGKALNTFICPATQCGLAAVGLDELGLHLLCLVATTTFCSLFAAFCLAICVG